MTIRRADMDLGHVDLTDVVDGGRLPAIHPGEVLREEFLAPLNLSVYALAGALHIPRTRLNDIALGRRSVTADTALRLSRYFGTSAEFWLNLQTRYDLEIADRIAGKRISSEITPRAA